MKLPEFLRNLSVWMWPATELPPATLQNAGYKAAQLQMLRKDLIN